MSVDKNRKFLEKILLKLKAPIVAMERIVRGEYLAHVFAEVALEELKDVVRLFDRGPVETKTRSHKRSMGKTVRVFIGAVAVSLAFSGCGPFGGEHVKPEASINAVGSEAQKEVNVSASIAKDTPVRLAKTRKPFPKEWAKLKGGRIMAVSEEAFDRAYKLVMARDEEALNKLFLSGQIRQTVEGSDVYVEREHFFKSAVEIRFKGDTQVYWVLETVLYDVEESAQSGVGATAQVSVGACKIEGISVDSRGAVVFVSHGKEFDPVEVGGRICGVEVVKIYAPREPDGVAPSNHDDLNDYRVRIMDVDGEKILKTGDSF